jgi:hypothetical protein
MLPALWMGEASQEEIDERAVVTALMTNTSILSSLEMPGFEDISSSMMSHVVNEADAARRWIQDGAEPVPHEDPEERPKAGKRSKIGAAEPEEEKRMSEAGDVWERDFVPTTVHWCSSVRLQEVAAHRNFDLHGSHSGRDYLWAA